MAPTLAGNINICVVAISKSECRILMVPKTLAYRIIRRLLSQLELSSEEWREL